MGDSSTVLTTQNAAVLTITLNRPEKLNAMTEAMSTALCAELKTAGANESVRCIVLRGAGKGFCTGQDLGALVGGSPAEFGGIVQKCYNPIITLISGIDKPIVAAVHGTAAGAGANIALSCDFVIASTEAFFIQSFANVGLVPDSGGTFFLPRILGLARATSLTMLGEKISAQDAVALGLIYKAVPPEEFEAALNILTQKLAAAPTKAIGLTKRLMRDGLSRDLLAQLGAEAAAQRTAGFTQDFQEGLKAFVEKRPPQFQGR